MRRRLPSYLFLLVICIALVSCAKSGFKGFKKTQNGTYMRFYEVHKGEKQPELGDFVVFSFNQFIGDSLIGRNDADTMELTSSYFVGDMMAGLLNMHIGDSATVVFLIDSVCYNMLGMDEVPYYLTPGMPFYVDMKLKGIIPAEEVAAQRKYELLLRKQADGDQLAMFYADENNTITENGLIILSVNGKGRGAKDGEILKINFNLITLDGDTLLDFYKGEPVAVRCGDKDLGNGFSEAMHYVPEGGEAHFVIPSSLAFDSVGLENSVLPYTSFILNVNNTLILSWEEYQEEQKKLQEAEEAENLKRLAEEPARIEKFVKDHNIKVAPSETGLYYLEIVKGNGAIVEAGDMVAVHYNMYNIEDQLIESSYGTDPLVFVYGSGNMVPGIEEALGNMRVGGRATIIVPSTIGFGDVAIDKQLPANSTVIFDLELIDVQKAR